MSVIKSKDIELVDVDSIIPNLKVDTEDLSKILKYKWHLSKGYARATTRENGFCESIRMHRLIINAPKGVHVDHINGNKLDNRKENLRICDSQKNQGNSKLRKDSTTGYKGVSFDKRKNKYHSRMRVQGSLIHIGYFESSLDAARAYNIAAEEWYGQYFRGNDV